MNYCNNNRPTYKHFNSSKNNENFKCPYPHCSFEGLINTLNGHMNTHIQSNPENAEDFRNNRKKRFSFHSRMLLKKAALLEEWNRGERMGLKLKRRTDTTGRGNMEVQVTNQHFRKFSDKGRQAHRKKREICPVRNEDLLLHSDDECKNGVKAFKGFQCDDFNTSELTSHETNDICISDDDEWECEREDQHNKLVGALGSLCAYDSNSDEETEMIDSKFNGTNNCPGTKPSISNKDADTAECVKHLTDESDKIENSLKRKCKHENATDKNRHKIRRKNVKPSLLQKLFQPQVVHERNVILQCVLHIVKNNYLDS